jgi:hypothetical protein
MEDSALAHPVVLPPSNGRGLHNLHATGGEISCALRSQLARVLAKYPPRRLWGLVHDSQHIAQNLQKGDCYKAVRRGFRDPRVRLQVKFLI